MLCSGYAETIDSSSVGIAAPGSRFAGAIAQVPCGPAASLGPTCPPGGGGRRASLPGQGLQGNRPSDFSGAALATAQGHLLLATPRSGFCKQDAGSPAGVSGSGPAKSARNAGDTLDEG